MLTAAEQQTNVDDSDRNISVFKQSVTGTTNGLRHGTQFGVPVSEEVVTASVEMRGDVGQVKYCVSYVVAKILKC